MSTVTLFRDFAEDRRTSMEVYADNLITELAVRKPPQLEVRAFRPRLGFARYLPDTANLRMRVARYLAYPCQVRSAEGTLNHILDHGYAHLMRVLNPAHTIVTVHDIIPVLAGRGEIRGVRRHRRSWLAEYTARFYRRAACIIAISESTRDDLVRHCGCDPRKIDVIYFGIRPEFGPMTEECRSSARRRLGLPAGEQLILITGQEYYKNHTTSLAVVEHLRATGRAVRLVRLGRPTAEWRTTLSASSLRHAVIQIEHLAAERMSDLYNAVDCLLFPSWYEGFGLPPVEAMSCGTPVVTSNVASLPEAAGDAGLTAHPDDVAGLAAHVARLFDDSAFRVGQIALGLQHAKRFDWGKNASSVLEIYRRTLDLQVSKR